MVKTYGAAFLSTQKNCFLEVLYFVSSWSNKSEFFVSRRKNLDLTLFGKKFFRIIWPVFLFCFVSMECDGFRGSRERERERERERKRERWKMGIVSVKEEHGKVKKTNRFWWKLLWDLNLDTEAETSIARGLSLSDLSIFMPDNKVSILLSGFVTISERLFAPATILKNAWPWLICPLNIFCLVCSTYSSQGSSGLYQ